MAVRRLPASATMPAREPSSAPAREREAPAAPAPAPAEASAEAVQAAE
jgi:hypothetical protein